MKMVISIVVEGKENEIRDIRKRVVTCASENLVSCSADVIEEPKKEIFLTEAVMYGNRRK